MPTIVERVADAQSKMADLFGKVGTPEFTDDDRTELNTLTKQINDLKGAAGAQEALNEMAKVVDGNAKKADQQLKAQVNGLIDRITDDMLAKAAGGGSVKIAAPELPGMVIGRKASSSLVGLSSGGGDVLAIRQDLGITVLPEFRRPTILDLVAKGTSNAELITWLEVVFTNNAAIVDEATAVAGTSGLKPDSENEFIKREATSFQLAHLKHITQQGLRNRGFLRGLVENELVKGLREKAEATIFTNPQWGILNASGVQIQPFVTDIRATLLHARKLVGLRNGTVEAVLLNPEDAVNVYLEKDLAGWYYNGGPTTAPTALVWGMPIVECSLVPQGQAVLGAFSTIHFDEVEPVQADETNSHLDFFARNIMSVRVEGTWIQRIERPDWLVMAELAA